ncbi:glycosyltransferase [Paremcibacter congregatus]|uniref:Glycosyl transferase family 1 n=1 Tax=Paremcibacter congregatus TaxID=2043170 RepID=A0A2G4YN83_9PROT|nr:glycosyltransferase [Paremcibacter congregatus]PHZ83755.1 hypothetical protein CRD36_15430 [Paremcibacter congregatus]QDE27456.1 glycosyltransferase [Paremcibacter congregatus]
MVQKNKIPHIFHVIPSFAHGGVPIRISYLMNHFGGRARHSLLSTDHVYSCRSRLSADIDLTIPDIAHADQGNILQRILAYRKIIKDLKPDLMLTYNWGSTEWALANRLRPLCRHYHLESGFGPEEALFTLPKRNYFRRLALGRIEGIVVPSQTLVKICQDDWHIPPGKIHYIPNGVDCEKYAAAPSPDALPGFKKKPGNITIGTMTPLRPEKNLSRLITAFKHLKTTCPNKDLDLVIMGEGNERAALEQMIREYGLEAHVYMPGHVDDPAKALGWLDIYAISSDTEQMPNSVNQAMAAGLPIVGMDVGDVKFMMNDLNRPFIAPARNDRAFAECLIALTTDDSLRQEIGQANKIHVKQTFDQHRMYESYASIWGV